MAFFGFQEQANEEATKQGWCDAELSTNKATREEKADASEARERLGFGGVGGGSVSQDVVDVVDGRAEHWGFHLFFWGVGDAKAPGTQGDLMTSCKIRGLAEHACHFSFGGKPG